MSQEHGYWQQDRGYFEFVDPPTPADIASLPEGTEVVPKKPSRDGYFYDWNSEEKKWDEFPLPPPDPAGRRPYMTLSFAQLLIGLVTEGWMSEEEGEGWLIGDLPETVEHVIEQLPPEHRFTARARAVRPSIVERLDPLVQSLALAEGKSEEDMDLFFDTYSKV